MKGTEFGKNEFIQELDKSQIAWGVGFGLAGLMALFAICALLLMCCKNKCFAVLVLFTFHEPFSMESF